VLKLFFEEIFKIKISKMIERLLNDNIENKINFGDVIDKIKSKKIENDKIEVISNLDCFLDLITFMDEEEKDNNKDDSNQKNTKNLDFDRDFLDVNFANISTNENEKMDIDSNNDNNENNKNSDNVDSFSLTPSFKTEESEGGFRELVCTSHIIKNLKDNNESKENKDRKESIESMENPSHYKSIKYSTISDPSTNSINSDKEKIKSFQSIFYPLQQINKHILFYGNESCYSIIRYIFCIYERIMKVISLINIINIFI